MLNIINQLQHVLTQAAANNPDKIALITGRQRFTYQQIDEQSNALANGLQELGVKRGDRVIVQLGNCVETIIAFWAILKANAIVSLISTELKPDKVSYILRDSSAKIFFASKWEHTNYADWPALEKIIVLEDIVTKATVINKVVLYEAVVTAGDHSKPPILQNLDIDLASIIYTSGSTGEPKGVMLTHRNMLTALNSLNTYLENSKNDKVVCVLPLSFDYGLYQMLMMFAVAGTLVLEKDLLWPTQLLKLIELEEITVLPGVPTLFSLLAEHFKQTRFDFSSLRCVTNTGAALSEKQISYIQQIFPQAKIYSMYGLTECKRCSYLPPQDIARKPRSVGIAIPNTELWIVDNNDQKLGPNQIGELVVRGATVMSGYWNKPEETIKKLRAGLLPFEKVLYTGDYCSFDTEGYLYFHGRMDEVIKSRGLKVSPKEIEDAIITLPGVKEVAVIGVADEAVGDAIHAYVSSDARKSVTANFIMEACKQKLENSKWPKKIVMVADLPKSANGKINKQALLNL